MQLVRAHGPCETSTCRLSEVASKLAYSTTVTLKRLKKNSQDLLHVFYSGGVFGEEGWFKKCFVESLREHFPSLEIARARFAPIIGSLLVAYRAAVGEVHDYFLDTLSAGADMKVP